MQERKRSGTATQSSPRKDEIEATKRIKILEPSPLTLLPCLSFVLPKKNKPGDFKGKAFLVPENWGYLQGDAKPTRPLLPPFLGDAARNWIEPVPRGLLLCAAPGLAHSGS